MEQIKDEIRSVFESGHYTDDEMIDTLEELKLWCDASITNIKEYMEGD